MEKFYQAIEEAIRNAGYAGPVNGEEIYDEICDEIEDKEPGAYVFMSKKTEDTFFEYKIQIFEDQFNLSAIDIRTPDQVYHADFD
ncbi:hypothetical protein [Clostridium sp. Marseille-P2415]|uniref:hypothetical protein n=1 Tax=Clostridium sp. Marseille-P2415 TaxID=1805471 RepID=UPI00098837CB|nr:hypothetical protein [Clostridium sp. Marseille-P2415]